MTTETWALITEDNGLIGRIIKHPQGYLFHPNMSAHKAGRVYRKTVNAAIPRWALNLSDNLVTWAEFKST